MRLCLYLFALFLVGSTKGQSVVEILAFSESHTTLFAAANASGLTGPLANNPLTLFAPVNEAFDKLPEGTVERLLDPGWYLHLQDLLLHHVVEGVYNSSYFEVTNATAVNGEDFNITSVDPTTINDIITVIDTDIEAENGIIHVIDGVILPTSAQVNILEIGEIVTYYAELPDTEPGSLSFGTLLSLAKLAGLDNTLATRSPITLFAPTNDAFNKLDSVIIDFLKNDANNEILQQILKYHILGFNAYAGQAESGPVETLADEQIQVAVTTNGQRTDIVLNGNVNVDDLDTLATNGVIHITDGVLIPPSLTEVIAAVLAGEDPSVVDSQMDVDGNATAPETADDNVTISESAPNTTAPLPEDDNVTDTSVGTEAQIETPTEAPTPSVAIEAEAVAVNGGSSDAFSLRTKYITVLVFGLLGSATFL